MPIALMSSTSRLARPRPSDHTEVIAPCAVRLGSENGDCVDGWTLCSDYGPEAVAEADMSNLPMLRRPADAHCPRRCRRLRGRLLAGGSAWRSRYPARDSPR